MITFSENKNSNNNTNNSNSNNNNNNNKLFKNILILIFLLSFLNLVLLKKIDLNFNNSNNNNNNNRNKNTYTTIVKEKESNNKFNIDSLDIKLTNLDTLHNIKVNKDKNNMGDTTTTAATITNKRVYWPKVYNHVESIDWNKCVLTMMGIDTTNKSIGYSYIELDKENGRLILSPDEADSSSTSSSPSNGKERVIIAHAKSCPFHELELSNSIIHKDLQIEKLYPPVKVGVSVLVEDNYNRILLTKRADTLRIFPKIWVCPGGHMEIGETFFETGLRELNEETGIDETMVDLESLKVIGIFESSYPNLLPEDKLPVDHHIVVFLYIKLNNNNNNHQTITPILQEDEVQLAAWTPKSLLIDLLEGTHNEFDLNTQHHKHTPFEINNISNKDVELIYPPSKKQQEEENDNGISIDKFKQKFFKGTDNIATGTIYILKQFLRGGEEENK